jgi:phage baseplate assembly protein W
MTGFGIDEYGAFGSGFAMPETAATPPENVPDEARFIDYRTKDYVLDDQGELERMPIQRQRVWLALTTLKGSSTVLQNFGVKLPGIIDSKDEAAVKDAVRAALSHMITDGSIILKDVRVESSEVIGRSKIIVEYEDQSTLESDKVES